MKLHRAVKWALRVIGGLILLLVVVVAFVAFIGISVSLNGLRPKIETAATEALDREIRIEGPIKAHFSLHPELRVEGFVIANPVDWEDPGTPFVRLDHFRARLGLLQLLKRRISIDKIEVAGLDASLEEKPDGRKNWIFRASDADEASAPADADADRESEAFKFIELRTLDIRGITVTEIKGEHSRVLTLDEIVGTAAAGQPVKLNLLATLQDKNIDLNLEGGPLLTLVTGKDEWPFSLSGRLLGIDLELKGEIEDLEATAPTTLDFHVRADDLEELGIVLDLSLPALGAIDLQGRAFDSPEGFELEKLTGTLGETTVSGRLSIDRTRKDPHIKGVLDLGRFDVATLSSGKEKGAAAGGTAATPGEEATRQTAPAIKDEAHLRRLVNFSGDLRLTCEEIVNPKTEIRDLIFETSFEENHVSANVRVNFSEAILEGKAELAAPDAETRTFDLDLRGKEGNIGKLIDFYVGNKDFVGKFGGLRFHLYGSGADLDSMWAARATELLVEDATLVKHGGEKELRIQLDRGEIKGAQGIPTWHAARGRFKDAPFDIEYRRLKPEKAGPDQDPILEFSGEAAGAKFSLQGITRRSKDDPVKPLALEVAGENLGSLAAWLGISRDANLPFSATGKAYLGDGWKIDSLDARVGATTVTGTVGASKGDDPLFTANLQLDTLHVPEIARIFLAKEEEVAKDDPSTPGGSAAAGKPGFDLDMPILPAEVHVDDADFDLAVDRVVFEKRELTGIAFAGQIRDGWMQPAPFAITIGKTAFSGDLAFDFRGSKPEAGILLATENADIGNLLGKLQLAEGFKGTADKLTLDIHARGAGLREILRSSDFGARFDQAVFYLKDENTKAELPIRVKTGRVGASAGTNLELELDAEIAETPLSLQLTTNGLAAFAREADALDFDLRAEIAGTRIEAVGDAVLPLDKTDIDVELSLAGDKFSDVDELLDLDLPPVGPYTLDGRFRLVDAGYSLTGLKFHVGESDLAGSVRIDTRPTPPRLTVDLATNSLQLDDFVDESWSPIKGTVEKSEEDTKKKVPEDQPQGQPAIDEKLRTVLNPDVLGSLDADLSLNVRQVLSGKDSLGGGDAQVTLRDGRLTADPLTLNLPGGSAAASFSVKPTDDSVDAAVTLDIEGFDYGIVARRKDPESRAGGLVDLDLDIRSTAPGFDEILGHADGHIHLDVAPEHLPAGIFDLWATNVLLALLPRLDPENKSTMNCIIARCVLEDGLLTPETVILDSTRVRAAGTGNVNFKTEEIAFRIQPTPKRPQFLSIETPITVTGSFDDFSVGLGNLGLPGLALRVTGNTVLYPVNFVFASRIPLDGHDICPHAARKPAEAPPP